MLIPCSKTSYFKILDDFIRVLLQIIIDEYDKVPLFINWNIFKMLTLNKTIIVSFYSDGKIVFVYFVFFFFQWRKSFYIVFPQIRLYHMPFILLSHTHSTTSLTT